MSVADWAARHRRSILFLMAVLAVGGAGSALQLPVALFPHVNFPRIVVYINAGSQPGEQMVIAVTRPLEQAVRSVPGVREVRSTTSRGSATLSVTFDWGSNMPLALQQIDSKVSQVLPMLPPGVTFYARRMNPTVFPVAAYSLTSSKENLVQLRNIAKYELVPILSSINGVARVSVLGGLTEEYHVDVDPVQLHAYGLTLNQVIKALSASNVLQAVGRLEDHYKLYLLLSDTRFRSLDQIGHTVLTTGSNGIVELEDVATVHDATVPKWMRVTSNQRDAVSLQIYQQPGGNTVQIVRDLKAALKDYSGKLPPDLKVSNWYDQSELITESAVSVRDAIVIGVLLASLVLLVFLRSFKITLVGILVVPAVMSATILLLYVLHMSFNIMTLGGMAAAVGLIIDDAIVMIENIIRELRKGGGDHNEPIRSAARAFTQPLTGSSLSTVIIFLPLAFLSGVTGAFFKALSLTMASALIISYLIAWMAIPILADRFLGPKDAEREDSGRITNAMHCGYRRVMGVLLRRQWWALASVIPLLAVGYTAYRHVGTGFMPSMDEGGFVLDYQAPPGTSLTETDRLLRQVEHILGTIPEVASYSRRTGAQLGGGITEANQGDFFIRLKPQPRRSVWDIMNDLRQRVHALVPGLDIEMAQLMEDLIGDLTAVPQPIEIKLFGNDTKELLQTAPKVAAAIHKIGGVVDVRSGIVYAGDALVIKVNRDKAALQGIDPSAVSQRVKTYFKGIVTTKVRRGIRMIGIRLRVPKTMRQTEDQLRHMWLQAPDGHRVPLDLIATVTQVTGQPQITRDNLKRMVAVTGRISGRDLGSTLADITKVLDGGGVIPKDMYYKLGGLYKQQQIAFRGLVAVMAGAATLVFLLLLFLYERFQVALSIIAVPLLALTGVFMGLWLTGIELNITAMMGMTMVLGIATEVAIFFFSEYRIQLNQGLAPLDALIEAGVMRMRPIAMTTLAAVLALLPLALGLGKGSAMQQPLAIAIISGLVVKVPLILFMMPVLFAKLARLKDRAGG